MEKATHNPQQASEPFGDALFIYRAQKHYSQEGFARQLGISLRQYGLLENNRVHVTRKMILRMKAYCPDFKHPLLHKNT